MKNITLIKQFLNPDKKVKKAPLCILVFTHLISHSHIAQAHPQECISLTAPVTFIESSGLVCLEKIKVMDSSGTQIFKAALQSLAPDKPNSFKLVSAEPDNRSGEDKSPEYKPNTGVLVLPTVDVPQSFGTERYTANLIFQPETQTFKLTTADVYLNPNYKANETWKPYGILNSNERRGVNLLAKSIPYAYLSDAVYSFDNTSVGVWELIEQADKDSGMQAGVYKSSETGEIALAFRGTEACPADEVFSCSLTEEFLDLAADALLAVGKVDEQFDHAFEFAKDVADRYQDRKITVTGHSLGGGLAQAIGASLGLETFAFNSAPVPEEFFDDYPSELTAQELFDSIFVLADIHDPVSNTIESGKAYLGSSHVTPIIQFDFNELEIIPDRLAELDALRFNKHGMEPFIENASAMLKIYRDGW